MKTIKIKLYEFSELDDKAKEKALSALYDVNVFDDWYEFIYDDFISIAQTIGVEVNKKQIYFSGFYSQGDGSAFNASVNIADLIDGISNQLWKTYAPLLELSLSPPNVDRRVLNLIKNTQLDCTGEIKQPARGYYIKACLTTCSPDNHDYININSELDKLETWLEETAETLNHYLYESLRDEYEYQTSEKAIIETIEANEYSFTADGKIATRIKNLAEKEL